MVRERGKKQKQREHEGVNYQKKNEKVKKSGSIKERKREGKKGKDKKKH